MPTGSIRPERANVGYYPLNTNIFEALVRLTPDYQIEPLLAESWEFVEPNTYRFTLRQGVTFHDGTPFTAEAVVWSMGRIAQAGGGILLIDENSTKAVDDFTVEITPAQPNRRLLEQLNHPNESIVATNTNPAEVRIGTGPFREVEYVKEDRYVVEAYDGYWGDDKPLVQRITFRFYPDPTTRVLALQSGEVDLIVETPPEVGGATRGGRPVPGCHLGGGRLPGALRQHPRPGAVRPGCGPGGTGGARRRHRQGGVSSPASGRAMPIPARR